MRSEQNETEFSMVLKILHIHRIHCRLLLYGVGDGASLLAVPLLLSENARGAGHRVKLVTLFQTGAIVCALLFPRGFVCHDHFRVLALRKARTPPLLPLLQHSRRPSC